jgi:hypothetical protein
MDRDTLTTWLALYVAGCVVYGAGRLVAGAWRALRDFLLGAPSPRRRARDDYAGFLARRNRERWYDS